MLLNYYAQGKIKNFVFVQLLFYQSCVEIHIPSLVILLYFISLAKSSLVNLDDVLSNYLLTCDWYLTPLSSNALALGQWYSSEVS